MSSPRGEEAIHWLVEVLWPGEDGEEDAWYSGEVLAFDENTGYHVVYEDGDEEDVQLTADGSNIKWKSRNKSYLDDEDEEDDGNLSSDLDEEEEGGPDLTSEEQISRVMGSIAQTEGGNGEEEAGDIPVSPIASPRHSPPSSPILSPARSLMMSSRNFDDDAQSMSNMSMATTVTSSQSRKAPPKRARVNMEVPKNESEWFFHDRESLLAQRKALEEEKAELLRHRQYVTTKLTRELDRSKDVKKQLERATAKAALVNVGDNYLKMAASNTSAMGAAHRTRTKGRRPKKQAEGDGELEADTTAEEIVLELEVLLEELQRSLKDTELDYRRALASRERAQKERSSAQASEARLSRRELQTLVEARMEMVLLLDEKKSLQSNQDHALLASMRSVREKERTQRMLSQRYEDITDEIDRTKEEIRLLQRFCRREDAKLVPLREHKAALLERRQQYRDSGSTSERTLLRSAFDRYDRDCSSKLSVSEIALALQDLSIGGGKVTQADIFHYLERHDEDGDGLVSFDEFCSVFDRLYTPRPV